MLPTAKETLGTMFEWMQNGKIAKNILLAAVGALFIFLDVTVAIIKVLELMEQLVIGLELHRQIVPRLRTHVFQLKFVHSSIKVLPVRSSGALVGFGEIEIESFMITKSSTFIHIIKAIGGIVLGERRDTGPDVGETDGHIRLAGRIEQPILITMGVTIELGQHRLIESVDDAQKVVQPRLCAFPIVRRNVSDDVHLVVRLLRLEQFVGQPLELIGRIDGVEQTPRIEASTVVGVDANDAQLFPSLHGIISTATQRWTNIN